MCVVFESLAAMDLEEFFDEAHFPKAVLDRRRIFLEDT